MQPSYDPRPAPGRQEDLVAQHRQPRGRRGVATRFGEQRRAVGRQRQEVARSEQPQGRLVSDLKAFKEHPLEDEGCERVGLAQQRPDVKRTPAHLAHRERQALCLGPLLGCQEATDVGFDGEQAHCGMGSHCSDLVVWNLSLGRV